MVAESDWCGVVRGVRDALKDGRGGGHEAVHEEGHAGVGGSIRLVVRRVQVERNSGEVDKKMSSRVLGSLLAPSPHGPFLPAAVGPQVY